MKPSFPSYCLVVLVCFAAGVLLAAVAGPPMPTEWLGHELARASLTPRAPAPLVVAPPKTNAVTRSVAVGWSFPDVRFEIWQSTDLQTWSIYTNAPCDVAFRIPSDKPQQFFKVRTVDRDGITSEWASLKP